MSKKEMGFIKLFDKKYVCVFCNERVRQGDVSISSGGICLCGRCSEALKRTSPSMPYPATRDMDYIMSPFEYADPLRRAILAFKFDGCRTYAPLFAKMMREYISSYEIWDDFDYIVPVPLHERRLKERGYNQSELICTHISSETRLPMRAELLTRIRETKQQSTLKRYDRILNVRRAFLCSESIDGKNIVLFDDICTTGNTLQACAKALHDAGAGNICALTLAIHTTGNLPLIMY